MKLFSVLLFLSISIYAQANQEKPKPIHISKSTFAQTLWYIKITDSCFTYFAFSKTDEFTDYNCEIDCSTIGKYKVSKDTLFLYEINDSCGEEIISSSICKLILCKKGLLTIAYKENNQPFKITQDRNMYSIKDSMHLIQNKYSKK